MHTLVPTFRLSCSSKQILSADYAAIENKPYCNSCAVNVSSKGAQHEATLREKSKEAGGAAAKVAFNRQKFAAKRNRAQMLAQQSTHAEDLYKFRIGHRARQNQVNPGGPSITGPAPSIQHDRHRKKAVPRREGVLDLARVLEYVARPPKTNELIDIGFEI